MSGEPVRFTVKPMDALCVERVAELEAVCFSEPWSLSSFLNELCNPLAVYYTLWNRDELMGYGGMHHILDEGHITNIAVAPAHRRKGAGAALLEALTGYALGHRLSMMTLEVRASNLSAIALYRRYGFEECGRRRGYYTRPREDALIMTRQLPPRA